MRLCLSGLEDLHLNDNTSHIENADLKKNRVINVVLAEDDNDDVLIFKLALNELEIAVNLSHVDNGDKLLALLKELLPDVIFIDVEMPCTDGISCVIQIRKNKDFDNVPVIIISGHENQKYIDETFSEGANYYVIKASSVKQLSESLKTVFSTNLGKLMYYPPKQDFVIGDIA